MVSNRNAAVGGFDTAQSYLLKVLSGLNEGCKLPSMREMKSACGTGQAALDKVLSRMVSEGRVIAKPRSGYFKGALYAKRTEILTFEPIPDAHSKLFYKDFYNQMLFDVVRDKRIVRVHEILDEPSECWFSRLEGYSEFTMLTFRMGSDNLPVINQLAGYNVSCLHILPNFVDYPAPAITIDDYALVQAQVDYMLSKGIKRIAYFHHATDRKISRARTQRLDAFYAIAVKSGLSVEPEYVCDVGNHGENVLNAVKKWRDCKTMPQGLIIYDEHVKQVYEALISVGLSPGNGIKVLGTDDAPWAEFSSPSLSSTRIDHNSFCALLLSSLDQLERGDEPGNHHIDIKIIERESTQ